MSALLLKAARGAAVAMAKAVSDDGLVWNKLFPKGRHFRESFPGGAWDITEAAAKEFCSNWTALGAPALPVDYFHDGESVPDGQPIDRKKASGWIEKLEVRAGELWGGFKWTDEARARIDKDEFRFLSPTWWWQFANPITGQKQGLTLVSAALLNDPFFMELPRVAASAENHAAAAANKEGNTMNREEMIAALGLKADATDADIKAALKANTEAARAAGDKVKEAEKAQATTASLQAQLQTSEKARAEDAKRLDALEKASKEREVKALCDRLVAERRIKPAQVDSVKEYASVVGVEKASDFYGKLTPDESIPAEPKGADINSNHVVDGKDFAALVAEKVKAGMSKNAAWRAVSTEHPEAYKKSIASMAGRPEDRR